MRPLTSQKPRLGSVFAQVVRLKCETVNKSLLEGESREGQTQLENVNFPSPSRELKLRGCGDAHSERHVAVNNHKA